MNEISSDSIKGRRWVGCLYTAEKEPRGRASYAAVRLRRGLEVEITLCKGSTSVATVRRFLKVEKSLEKSPTWRQGCACVQKRGN
ncbi:hypothetical protein Y032_0679g1455 [Ancylostoma ceylanicum]|uniref:Uncharacterized protein n=1 Tax=Ancylostoma ceylanicum TaxID=53326 RepID=A0A016WHJ0_9BILA|nr:hypothetical protein Y032_0679g1455 [Ancylostoma ceylanicum]